MVKTIYLTENEPYPNSSLPVLFYEGGLGDALEGDYSADDVLKLFENNGYTHGWVSIIEDRHHFHSYAHEVLAVTKGEVTVQLGGQNGKIQAQNFYEVTHVDGIILTKLDSTAKGGVVFSIVLELYIPILYVGTGEQVDDIEEFNIDEFVDAII